VSIVREPLADCFSVPVLGCFGCVSPSATGGRDVPGAQRRPAITGRWLHRGPRFKAARCRALLATNGELMPAAERKMVPTEADLVAGAAAALERFDPIDR
jgi:hypothetical protein